MSTWTASFQIFKGSEEGESLGRSDFIVDHTIQYMVNLAHVVYVGG